MTAFLYKFSTTQTQQTGAVNRMLAEIRQGFNGLYADFGGDLGDKIQDKLFASPITVGMNVSAYSAGTRPDDTGTMQFCYIWNEFSGVSTPGFYCDLLVDLGGTTVDPIWFQETIQQRWSRGNKTVRATTPEQQAVNGGKTEVEFVSTGDDQTVLCAPEFGRHAFFGVLNEPLTGTPDPDAVETRRGPNG